MRCFLMGYHNAGEAIYPVIAAAVRHHIEKLGVDEFVVGQYGAFDRMAVRAVIEAKRDHPDVRLSVLLAYHPSEREIHAPEGYDATIYPPGMETVPKRLAIVRANRYMAEHSDYLIVDADRPGNTRNLCDAIRKKKIGAEERICYLHEKSEPSAATDDSQTG